MEYCDFPAGKYRAFITSVYLDAFKTSQQVDSNIFYFESTQPVEELLVKSADVAIAHQYYGRKDANTVWLCYIGEDDVLKVKYSKDEAPCYWYTYTIPYTIADKCSICFDARIQSQNSINEFITDEIPWVCYTRNGALYILDLTTGISSIVVPENVVDLDMIRGPITRNDARDYGLIVFFLMENQIYYKQRINRVWYDAEVVNVNTNGTYEHLAAFRTWDYRTGVQVINSDGELYQFITYPEGLFDMREHVEFNDISAITQLIWGWSAVPILVENLNTSGNWGVVIRVTFDWPNTESGLSPTMFTLVDSNNINYVCQSCSLSPEGTQLVLRFDDFNLAGRADNVTLTYTKPASGGLISPAVQTNSFAETFVPVNLDPPQIDPPTFSSASNSDAMTIDLVLTEMMLNTDVSDMLSHFTITWQEYDYIPGGALHTETRSLASISKVDDTTLRMVINKPSFTSVIGDITISYDGLGGLRGLGGPASDFEGSFTPTGLIWKGHQNDIEHIEFNDIEANIILTALGYYDTKSSDEHIEFNDIEANIVLRPLVYTDSKTSDEHIEFSDISATIVLTDIHDI